VAEKRPIVNPCSCRTTGTSSICGEATPQLTWFDSEGSELDVIAQPANFEQVRLSPDDQRLAATVIDESSGRGDIWIYDVKRKVGSRLTFNEAHDTAPVWSPDGTRIAFQSNRASPAGDVFVRSADGRGKAELLFSSEGGEMPDEPHDWSPDGRYLAINRGVGKVDLWIVPLDGDDPFKLVGTEFDEGYARFSTDGRWLAYISNESGRYELYLTRFPDGEGKWQLSVEGADWLVGHRRPPAAAVPDAGRRQLGQHGGRRALRARRSRQSDTGLPDHAGRGLEQLALMRRASRFETRLHLVVTDQGFEEATSQTVGARRYSTGL
jgi:dipeptidyl aminopeptidase/acylaminoacyl peptidase